MNIAKNIINKFGGYQKFSEVVGVSLVQAYRMTYPRDRGGTDGLIPSKHQRRVLDEARRLGIDITPNDFFE